MQSILFLAPLHFWFKYWRLRWIIEALDLLKITRSYFGPNVKFSGDWRLWIPHILPACISTIWGTICRRISLRTSKFFNLYIKEIRGPSGTNVLSLFAYFFGIWGISCNTGSPPNKRSVPLGIYSFFLIIRSEYTHGSIPILRGPNKNSCSKPLHFSTLIATLFRHKNLFHNLL